MPSKLKLTSLPQKPAAFIEPMDCLAVTKLPDSTNWVWEIKIDGYRAICREDRPCQSLIPHKKLIQQQI